MIAELPDALADALGSVVSDARRDCYKEIERIDAQSRALVAELQTKVVQLEIDHRAQMAAQAAAFAAQSAEWQEAVKHAIANVKDGDQGPQGERGAPGEKGDPGAKGDQGETGLAGKDGLDGERGEVGPAGVPGVQGEQGQSGRDGLPGVPGRDGKDGDLGKDGLGFEDMSTEFDGERTLTLNWSRGELGRKFSFALPIPLDRGVYRDTETYCKGDGVSYDGSWWFAQTDAPKGKPDAGTGDWRLSIKRGRDGKDGKQGPKGEKGDPGREGRVMRQLTPDGKWGE